MIVCVTDMRAQVDDSGHRIRPDPPGNGVLSGTFPPGSGRKRHRKMEAVFRPEIIVPGNEKVRKVPFTGFSQKMAWIRVGNKPEFSISRRDWTETLRTTVGYQMENIRFRRSLVK